MLTLSSSSVSFNVQNLATFKAQAFSWAGQYTTYTFLDSHQDQLKHHSSYRGLLAIGAQESLVVNAGNAFDQLRDFYEERPGWLFGYLSYDLKNEVEALSSKHFDGIGFPELHFYRPQVVIECYTDEVKIHSEVLSPEFIFCQIIAQEIAPIAIPNLSKDALQSRFSKAEYCHTVRQIREHIIAGDIYEMNFCQEFFVEKAEIDPLSLFSQLNSIGQAPFSAFHRWENHYLLSASPERFLRKEGNQLISQPIKGTIHRGKHPEEDERLRQQLYNSEKDRAENVMIVDLVRNDLAKSCRAGTVKVEELFGIYSFPQVSQMISTIKGELREEVHFIEAIKNAFPMGSMTGAPKVMSMKLIEQYEKTRRGLYSGAVGYIKPNGDFDFNVVIRSMLYNAVDEYLSFQVGGAIVYDSVPEQEYEECLLKAKGILQVLGMG